MLSTIFVLIEKSVIDEGFQSNSQSHKALDLDQNSVTSSMTDRLGGFVAYLYVDQTTTLLATTIYIPPKRHF